MSIPCPITLHRYVCLYLHSAWPSCLVTSAIEVQLPSPRQGVLSVCPPARHLRTPRREVPSQVVALSSLLLAAEVLYVLVYFTMALRAFSYLRSRWVSW